MKEIKECRESIEAAKKKFPDGDKREIVDLIEKLLDSVDKNDKSQNKSDFNADYYHSDI